MTERQKVLFSQKVNKSKNGCWEWTANLNNFGYGLFWYNKKAVSAHRLSWMIHNGPIPKGLNICHTCDNPKCVRPEHLWIGTQAENNADKIRKGRLKPNLGENNGRSKLSWSDVEKIKEEYKTVKSYEALAKKYGVKGFAISRIIRGKTWARK